MKRQRDKFQLSFPGTPNGKTKTNKLKRSIVNAEYILVNIYFSSLRFRDLANSGKCYFQTGLDKYVSIKVAE